VTDFESNYLAAIDFYDEDFPWRYSPLTPDGGTHRLSPWLVLVVLTDGEFTRNTAPGRPLTSFVLTSTARRADIFPVVGQEWAWAHVHVNAALGGKPASPDLTQLAAALAANPDLAYARVLSPRRLQPNQAYTAFLVPSFEVGRKAGLGEAVADDEDGTVRSWAGAADEFPIYFEWGFRTGVAGDFESLVRALVPHDMDPRVGIRDLDIAHPGYGVDTVSNLPDGLVGFEGALLAPTSRRRGLASGSSFVPQVVRVLNAPIVARSTGSSDPLVAPPIYGCWHARVASVHAAPGWVNQLNLDPRYRAAAGLGAHVIRAGQERYIRVAWDQIGDVLTVNHQIRRAQLATKAAFATYVKSFAPLSPERAVALAAPVFAKVLGSRLTLAGTLRDSRVPRAAVSAALRKQLRPRGRLVRQVFAADARPAVTARFLGDINTGRLSAAPPRPPVGGATLEQTNAIVAQREGGGVPPTVPPRPQPTTTAILSAAGLTPAAVAATPPRGTFTFASASTDALLPPAAAPRPGTMLVTGDSAAAADMRRALIAFGDALSVRVEPAPIPPALDLADVHRKAVEALEPHRAFATRFASRFRVGDVDALMFARTRYGSAGPSAGDVVQEVMNYPDIKDAMSAALQDISSEYFVPNLRLVPNNTISLLRTNQPFIEAFLVGLNHEFARELLWREYPTDQRGSYFRQFWEVSSYVDRNDRTAKDLAEALKDIPPLHEWAATSSLGAHDHRAAQGETSRVVLIIRGDLLKRYPNTFIYAQKATWGTGARATRLVLSDETGGLFATAPKDLRLRFPLYRARVLPDIHFVGFDLTLEEARGDARLDETAPAKAVVGDKLGWFFVLQEAVGEPRFGLDLDAPTDPSPERWDNLAWVNLDLGGGQAINVAKPFVTPPPGANPRGVEWGATAADMAYIFYREPVMVAIHGRTMLKNLKPS
jgi:hypothetical protein